MKIKFIGTGGMVPSITRGPSCYLFESGEVRGLLDIGHTSIKKLIDQNIALDSIDFVSISHFHTDHAADLIPLAHSRFVIDLLGGSQKKELTVVGPPETESVLNKLFSVFWRENKIGGETYPINVVSENKFEKYGLKFETFPVLHKDLYECQAIKVSDNSKTLAFAGDLGCANSVYELVKNLKDVDVLIIEAGRPDETPSHFHISKTIELKEKANIKKVYLVHIRDAWMEQYRELLGNTKDIFFTNDGMEIEI
jgi:ribonuclease BN (tRNA processing enzyme)